MQARVHLKADNHPHAALIRFKAERGNDFRNTKGQGCDGDHSTTEDIQRLGDRNCGDGNSKTSWLIELRLGWWDSPHHNLHISRIVLGFGVNFGGC